MENKETIENGVHNNSSENKIDSNQQNGKETSENEKLRGDAIGNTVYSGRYVLETLLKLKDNVWDKELEDDMCCIWDMTLDKDVVDFLLENNFIDLSIEIIKGSKELRLIEILVGIIGNMCTYQVAAEKTIESAGIDVLLSLVFSEDTPTLIQLMRLFKALLFCEEIDCKSILTDDILNQIDFILTSATNIELLGYTLQVTGTITNKNSELFLKINFLDSVCEAYHEIINDNNGKVDLADELKHLASYLKIIENFCSLVNEEMDPKKISNIIDKFSDCGIENNMSLMKMYLYQFSTVDYMLHESHSLEYFVYCFANFLVSFQTEPNNKIFDSFTELYHKILENNLEETFETDIREYISNYLIYFVENKTVNELKDVLKDRPKIQIKKIFVDDIVEKYDCSEKFKTIVNELCL